MQYLNGKLQECRVNYPFGVLQAFSKQWCIRQQQGPAPPAPPHEATMSIWQRLNYLELELTFVVVFMSLMGSTLCIASFVRLFFPLRAKFLSFHLFLHRYNLMSMVRFGLNFAFFQFVPLLSSAISASKMKSDHHQLSDTELFLIFLWMFLVEIIRRKVQGMLLPTDGSSFSRGIGRFTLKDYAYDLSHLVWLVYLIYANMTGCQLLALGPIFAVLWFLCLTKLLQSAVNRWMVSTSWHTARNPLLIAGYMQKVMEKEHESTATEDCMSSCKFVVMGEERLMQDKTATATNKLPVVSTHGYGYCDDKSEQKLVHLHMDDPDKHVVDLDHPDVSGRRLVTVGTIWNMHTYYPNLFYGKRRQNLEDLCLSFSLFKMLRRRFEHYPMVEVGSAMARTVMLDGVLKLENCEPKGRLQNLFFLPCGRLQKLFFGGLSRLHQNQVQRVFQVLQLELEILKNYYMQSAAPVVMSQPIIFFTNSISFVLFLFIFVGAVFYVLVITQDAELLYCRVMGYLPSSKSPVKSPVLYLSLTLLLVLTVIAIEAHEFWTVYVFSNWNIVRLLCSYNRRYNRLWLRRFYSVIIMIRFATFSLSKSNMSIYQVSIFDACGAVNKRSPKTIQVTLPENVTKEIINTLYNIDRRTGAVTLPTITGLKTSDKTTTTDIILVCHLATELLEMYHDDQSTTAPTLPAAATNTTLQPAAATNTALQPATATNTALQPATATNTSLQPATATNTSLQLATATKDYRQIASMLSKYCMYLLVHRRQMLPDDDTWVSSRYEDVSDYLDCESRWCDGAVCPSISRTRKKMIADKMVHRSHLWRQLEDTTAQSGVKLFHELKQLCPSNVSKAWELLANFWVHLVIYLAPSNDVQGHAEAVASWGGGDLITCLWALCTHAEITRRPADSRDGNNIV
ncbi:hypothetical protein ABZP36_028377 [Zizania latifolia]